MYYKQHHIIHVSDTPSSYRVAIVIINDKIQLASKVGFFLTTKTALNMPTADCKTLKVQIGLIIDSRKTVPAK